MIDLSINELSKYYGANKVFEHLSMDIQQGERVGLIGPNGCGKTTLMKILTKEEGYDDGSVSYRKGLKLGYLSQMPDYDENMKVSEVMTLAFDKLQTIRDEMTAIELEMADLQGDELDKALTVYGNLTHRFESEGGYEVETRMSIISEGLKLSESFKEQPFGSLSGGEKTRVELAKTLLESPDVLLLDEPSNHLDMSSIEWLEDFLKNYKGTAIIISHDRYFLDRVVNRIIEMTFDKLIVYLGNYSHYVVEKERRFLLELKYYEQQQKKIKRMEDQIKRYRVWGAMRDSDKMYRKAKELEKRLEKIDKMDRPVFDNAKVKLRFDHSSRSGKRVLKLQDVSKAYPEKDLFEAVNLDVFFGESICMIGDNGTGKSTLLRMMIHEACQDEGVAINYTDDSDFPVMDTGEISFGSRLKVGYLPQEVVFENDSMTVIEYFQDQHNLSIGDARRELAKVLFVRDDVNKRIGSLSGGEKSRLKLCSLMYDQINLMILDEPTNHLDIDSREILEETLVAFDGTILFVSHDRYFIAKIANRMAEISRKSLLYYAGNYEYYREQKAKGVYEQAETEVVREKKSDTRIHNRQGKVPQKYRLEYKDLETAIEKIEIELETIASDMVASPDDAEALSELYTKEQSLNETLQGYYERWEELSEMFASAEE